MCVCMRTTDLLRLSTLYTRFKGGQALWEWAREICNSGSSMLPPISDSEGTAFCVCDTRTLNSSQLCV